jgi:hypothetical protein
VFVSRTKSVPPEAMVKMSPFTWPSLFREKAIREPSGQYDGLCSSAMVLVRRLRPVPSGFIDQMSNSSERPVSQAMRPFAPGNAARATGEGPARSAHRASTTNETAIRARFMISLPDRIALHSDDRRRRRQEPEDPDAFS